MLIRSLHRPWLRRVVVVLLLTFGTQVASAGFAQVGGGSHTGGGFSAAGRLDGGYTWLGKRTGAGGGWGWGKWGRWAWGSGLGGIGLGEYRRLLPLDYATLWWAGVPYYYVDHAYYLWDDRAGEYQQVAPPPSLAAQELPQHPSRLAPTASR